MSIRIDPRTILTEEAWTAVAPDCKGKEKELAKALFFYWTLEDDDYDFRIKAMTKVAALASGLKAVKEVATNKDVMGYLNAMVNAAKAKQGELSKSKVETLRAEAMTLKKAQAEKKHEEAHAEDEEDEDAGGDSYEKLKRLFGSLKTAQDPYHFLVCKDKPYGLVLGKRDISKNAACKKELSTMAGGSTTPPRYGQCRRDGNKLILEMDKPPTGLARVLQKWIKETTGLVFKVSVGNESSDDEVQPETQEAQANEKPEKSPANKREADAGNAAPEAGAPKKVEEEPNVGATRPFEISASVGAGGKNKLEDVQAVQAALNKRNNAGLEVDGKCGPKTVASIKAYQKTLNMPYPDGLVEVGKATASALGGKPVPASDKPGNKPAKPGGGAIEEIGKAMGPAIEAAKKAAKEIAAGQAQGDRTIGETLNRIKQAVDKKIGSGNEARKIKEELEKAYKDNQEHAKKVGQLLEDLAKRKTDEVAEKLKKAAEIAKPVVQTVEETVRKAAEWLQKNAPGLREDPNDLAKRVAKEIADQKKRAEQFYNDAVQKMKKAVSDQAGPEGKVIKDELEKAYNQTKESIKKVEEAAKQLVNRKTDEAIKALIETAKKTEPIFKAVEDQAEKALNWVQQTGSSVVDGAKDIAKKVSQEVAQKKQEADKAYNDIINKMKKAAENELGPEGKQIRDELEKAYKENAEHAKKVAQAAADLAKRKTEEAAEALKKVAQVAVPGYQTVADLSQKAMDWWNSD